MEPKKPHLLSPMPTKPAFSLHGPHSPWPFPVSHSALFTLLSPLLSPSLAKRIGELIFFSGCPGFTLIF